jgi:hypothetical protein
MRGVGFVTVDLTMWQTLEHAVNELNDKAWAWWPFLFMRPPPSQRLTSARVLLLSVLYGLPPALLANLVMRVTHERPELNPLLFPAASVILFFAVFRVTFAWCWNRRAARLSRTRELCAAQEED